MLSAIETNVSSNSRGFHFNTLRMREVSTCVSLSSVRSVNRTGLMKIAAHVIALLKQLDDAMDGDETAGARDKYRCFVFHNV